MADVLRARLGPIAQSISVAFIYGSIAKGSDTARSDVDVLIVSDRLAFTDLIEALGDAREMLGREVNPSIYRRVEFEKKASEEGGFLARVVEGQKIFLIGADSDIPKPGKARSKR